MINSPHCNGVDICRLMVDMMGDTWYLGGGGRIRRFFPDPIYIHYKFLNMF